MKKWRDAARRWAGVSAIMAVVATFFVVRGADLDSNAADFSGGGGGGVTSLGELDYDDDANPELIADGTNLDADFDDDGTADFRAIKSGVNGFQINMDPSVANRQIIKANASSGADFGWSTTDYIRCDSNGCAVVSGSATVLDIDDDLIIVGNNDVIETNGTNGFYFDPDSDTFSEFRVSQAGSLGVGGGTVGNFNGTTIALDPDNYPTATGEYFIFRDTPRFDLYASGGYKGSLGWDSVNSEVELLSPNDDVRVGASAEIKLDAANDDSSEVTVTDGVTTITGTLIIPSGADPPGTCTVGEIYIDTDTTTDTNCTTAVDGDICVCEPANTWTSH